MPDWPSKCPPDGWGGRDVLIGAAALTVATFVLSIAVCAVVVVRLPPDYFATDRAAYAWGHRHPAVRWPLLIAKNLFGLFLVLLGIVLSVPGVPGQGILTVLTGAMLVDFPGKRRAERWLLGRHGVLRSINAIRARYGRPPLVLDAPSGLP